MVVSIAATLLIGVIPPQDPPVAQVPPVATAHYLQVETVDGCVREALARDCNGDGRRDLILALGPCNGDDADTIPRRLRIYFQRDGRPAFASHPDRELRLPRNTVCFAVADLHPNPGAELLLFAPSLVVGLYWPPDSAEPTAFEVSRPRFLWQPASTRSCFEWQAGIVDVDGDGLDDVVMPEPDGHRIAVQRRGADGVVSFLESVLEVPLRPIEDEDATELRFTRQADRLALPFQDGNARNSLPLIDIEDIVPAPQFADWDGDGDVDLCALAGRERLSVWTQEAGQFRRRPRELVILPKREAPLINPAFSVQLHDVDVDGVSDIVLTSSRTQDKEVRSTIEVFLRSRDGALTPEAVADDQLRIQGFVGVPVLDDIDGDGRPELSIGSFRPDAMAIMSSGGAGKLDIQLNVFRNDFAEKRQFARPVAMVHEVAIEGGDLQSRGRGLARFFRDVNRDGLADLLMRTGGKHLAVFATEHSGSGFRIGAELWQLAIDESASLSLMTDGEDALIVRESSQVIYVEFR